MQEQNEKNVNVQKKENLSLTNGVKIDFGHESVEMI